MTTLFLNVSKDEMREEPRKWEGDGNRCVGNRVEVNTTWALNLDFNQSSVGVAAKEKGKGKTNIGKGEGSALGKERGWPKSVEAEQTEPLSIMWY